MRRTGISVRFGAVAVAMTLAQAAGCGSSSTAEEGLPILLGRDAGRADATVTVLPDGSPGDARARAPAQGDAGESRLGLVVYTTNLTSPTLAVQALATVRLASSETTIFGTFGEGGAPNTITETVTVTGNQTIRTYYDRRGMPVLVLNETTGVRLLLGWGVASVALTYQGATGAVTQTVAHRVDGFALGQAETIANFDPGAYVVAFFGGSALVLPSNGKGTCDAWTTTPGATSGSAEAAFARTVDGFLQKVPQKFTLLACDLIAKTRLALGPYGDIAKGIVANVGADADPAMLAAIGALGQIAHLAYQVGGIPDGASTSEGYRLLTASQQPTGIEPTKVPVVVEPPMPKETFFAYFFSNPGAPLPLIGSFAQDGSASFSGDVGLGGGDAGGVSTATLRTMGPAAGSGTWLENAFTSTFMPATSPCGSAGDVCTLDLCVRSTWGFHPAIVVDDSNVCTTDACNSTTGIAHTPINIDDGNACTADACDPVTGVSHTPIACNDGDLCTNDTCVPATGCVFTPKPISDGDGCTTDACNPATGAAIHTPIAGCCRHSLCQSDGRLNATACSWAPPVNDDCAAKVCAVDPYCCTNYWDSICVAETKNPAICPTGSTAFTCACAHSYCTAGVALANLCDPCVKRICEVDPGCCTTSWNSTCVDEAHTICHIPVGSECL
jgi:hypothetical protein